jgi:hypothetical protein
MLSLVFNVAVFSFWGGHDYFMFTLHWQPCLLVLLAGIGLLRGKSRIAGYLLCLTILVTTIVWNLKFFESVLPYF